MIGDELGQPVDMAVAHLQHAAGVLEHGARLQAPEGDDLRDPVAAVLLLDVGDDLVAARFAEVDVEVGHRHAFGVEEALEQQVERQRIEVGDGQRPGDDRARARTAARTDRNVVRLRPFDEVGDDQEVAREAHAGDDVDLEVEPLAIARLLLLASSGKPRVEPGMGIGAELLVLVVGQARKDRPALRSADRAALSDDRRVRDRLGQIDEQLAHRRRVLQPRFGRGGLTIVALDVGGLGDAQHRVMRGMEARVGVSGRIGRDQRQVPLEGKIDQRLFRCLLDRVVAADDLDVQPIREDRLQTVEIDLRLVLLAIGKKPGERALRARGQRDQALARLLQGREGNVRVQLDRTIQVRRRDEMAEVAVALLVLRQQHEPVDRRAARLRRPRNGEHRADDRLHALAEQASVKAIAA